MFGDASYIAILCTVYSLALLGCILRVGGCGFRGEHEDEQDVSTALTARLPDCSPCPELSSFVIAFTTLPPRLYNGSGTDTAWNGTELDLSFGYLTSNMKKRGKRGASHMSRVK